MILRGAPWQRALHLLGTPRHGLRDWLVDVFLPEQHPLSTLATLRTVDSRTGMAFGVPGAQCEMQTALETLTLEHGKGRAKGIRLGNLALPWFELIEGDESRSLRMVLFPCHDLGIAHAWCLALPRGRKYCRRAFAAMKLGPFSFHG
jgi:hypothetical protein